MTHVLELTGKVLALAGFVTAFTLVLRFSFPKSAARVKGSVLIYAGGMTSGTWTGSLGTARMELGGYGVAIRGRGPFRPLIGWEARYEEIGQVQALRAPGKSGLLLRGPDGPIVFWTSRWAEIADLLDLRAVSVNRSVSKFRRNDFF